MLTNLPACAVTNERVAHKRCGSPQLRSEKIKYVHYRSERLNLIKNTIKTAILWNSIITSKITVLYLRYFYN